MEPKGLLPFTNPYGTNKCTVLLLCISPSLAPTCFGLTANVRKPKRYYQHLQQKNYLQRWGTSNVQINPLNTKRRPLYLKTQSVPCCKHFSYGYKNQSVYAVSGTSRCLFSDKYKTWLYPFTDERQTALFKDPVRTAL